MTESYKFKKGDRVRFTVEDGHRAYRGETLLEGSVGTVIQDCSCPYVAWDGFTGGHDYETNDGATNQWAVDEDDLELLVEPSVEAFKIGQRVRVTDAFDRFNGYEGVVAKSNYAPLITVHLDCEYNLTRFFCRDQLTSIEQAPASPPKPECYVTAWVEEGDFHLTGDVLVTKQDADASANLLVGCHPGKEVAVFKLVSKHSSAVTVTSEDA